jgi:hypothetical protein
LVISCSIIIVPAKYVFHHQKSYLTIKIYIASATSEIIFHLNVNTTLTASIIDIVPSAVNQRKATGELTCNFLF